MLMPVKAGVLGGFMRYMRAIMLGVALIAGSASLASAQVLSLQLGGGDRDDRQAYSEGYRQGRWDGEHNRRADWDDSRWREADDRRAYRNGYLRGYNEVRRYNDHDRDDGYYRGGGGPGYGLNNARQYGYQDGYNDGLRDRQTGHSFRPTHDDNYRDANRGWDSRMVSSNDYKYAYRQAYSNGYERGYNSNGGYRR